MSIKIFAILVLLIVLVIFAVQNTQPLNLKFLFWGFETSAVLYILLSFGIGFLMGWLVHMLGARKKKDHESLSSLP